MSLKFQLFSLQKILPEVRMNIKEKTELSLKWIFADSLIKVYFLACCPSLFLDDT